MIVNPIVLENSDRLCLLKPFDTCLETLDHVGHVDKCQQNKADRNIVLLYRKTQVSKDIVGQEEKEDRGGDKI